MRDAIARADVGDDVYGEDPTVSKLEARVAELLGKEAALFVPSGTMSNQIALLCHARPGDEVIAGEGAHIAFYESGAAAAWAGVQVVFAGRGGLFDADDLEAAIKPPEYYHPRTRLVAIENTHNRAGGRVFPQRDVIAIANRARERGLALHLDGARLWNASVATQTSVAELAAPFDTVSVCFSKGLGAPVGSTLVGTRETILAARRFRKMLGAGMRQVGILAAAAIYALDHNLARLHEDHAAARALADAVRDVKGADVTDPETNLLNVTTPGVPAARVVEAAKRHGVLIGASGPERVRAVTHLDLPAREVTACATAFAAAVREAIGS
jgi:threonine aldolase